MADGTPGLLGLLRLRPRKPAPPAARTAATTEWKALMEDIAEAGPGHLAEARPAVPDWRADLPPGVLGYLVGHRSGNAWGTTHTTPMSLEDARAEAKAHGAHPSWSWFPVEIREVPGD